MRRRTRKKRRNPDSDSLRICKKNLRQDIDAVLYEHEVAYAENREHDNADNEMIEAIGKLMNQYKKDARNFDDNWDEKN